MTQSQFDIHLPIAKPGVFPTYARPSFSALCVEAVANTNTLASATAFVAKTGAAMGLVTNRHVVSGRHQETGQPLHPSGAIPDTLRVFHNKFRTRLQWVSKEIALFDSVGNPRWIEHPIFGGRVDVVLLPLDDVDGTALFPFDPSDPGRELTHGIGGFLNIVGYPFGLGRGASLAVWIKGALASEPSLEFRNLPAFLVDSRTRPGQSGSPVLLYQHSGATSFPDHRLRELSFPVEYFLGVYSGRISEESDLGIVWKRQVVADLLSAS
jgi:hypothetical protein